MATPSAPFLLALLLVLAPGLLVLAPGALAQRAAGEGTIQGRVTEAETGEPLPGANVILAGTSIGAATDTDGRFVLRSVPAGEQTLYVTFIGYETVSRTLTVRAERQTVDFELAPAVMRGGEIVVEAVLRGQARALNQQRNAETIVHVVSSEQLDRFADETAVEAIRRLPGVSTDHDRGEPDGLRLRGLGTALHTVTIDGQRMASTNLGSRATDLSGIPSDLISAIEVTKAFTPDMEGEATSGNVNIVTRRPIGRERLLRARAAAGYNNLAGTFGSFADAANYRIAATIGERSTRLNYALNANYRRDGRFQEDIRHQWRFDAALDRPVLAILEPSAYPIQRDLLSVAANAELYQSRVTTLLGRAAYSRRVDAQDRHQYTMEVGRGMFSPDNTTTGQRGRIGLSARTYTNTRDQVNATIGAEHAWSRLQLDYGATYAYGREVRDPILSYAFRADGFDFRVDDANPRRSTAEVIAGDPDDLSRFRFHRFQSEWMRSSDHNAQVHLNASVPFTVGGQPGQFKAGLLGRVKWIEGERHRRRYNAVTTPLSFADVGTRAYHGIFGAYAIPLAVDWRLGAEVFHRDQGRFVEDVETGRVFGAENAYSGREQLGAAYAMATFDLGAVRLLGGARVESTANTYDGFRSVFTEDGAFAGADPLSGSSTTLHVLPALHARVQATSRTNLRVAATRTLQRPSFEDLAPTRSESFSALTIRQGNPTLRPAQFNNLDLLAEHFFQDVGLLSGGVFFKYATGVPFVRSRPIVGGEFDGWIEETPLNASDAYVAGFEVAWQQELRFLPGVLRGLGVFANYTYTWSAADYDRDRRYPILGTTPHVLNAALSYTLGGFSSQLSLHYQSTTFLSTSTRLPDEITQREPFDFADRYRRIGTGLDFSASQRVRPLGEVFLELNNLLNSSNFDYYGDPRFPYRENAHSWFANLGLRVDL